MSFTFTILTIPKKYFLSFLLKYNAFRFVVYCAIFGFELE